jgi:hypothetical protein
MTGGGSSHNGTPGLASISHSYPSNITTWTTTVTNNTGGNITVTAYAVCVENPIA